MPNEWENNNYRQEQQWDPRLVLHAPFKSLNSWIQWGAFVSLFYVLLFYFDLEHGLMLAWCSAFC